MLWLQKIWKLNYSRFIDSLFKFYFINFNWNQSILRNWPLNWLIYNKLVSAISLKQISCVRLSSCLLPLIPSPSIFVWLLWHYLTTFFGLIYLKFSTFFSISFAKFSHFLFHSLIKHLLLVFPKLGPFFLPCMTWFNWFCRYFDFWLSAGVEYSDYACATRTL